MIYRGPSLLVVVWLGSFTPPPPLSSQKYVCLAQSSRVPGRAYWRPRDGGWWGGRGAKSYDRLESLVLYKSFHTLFPKVFIFSLKLSFELGFLYERNLAAQYRQNNCRRFINRKRKMQRQTWTKDTARVVETTKETVDLSNAEIRNAALAIGAKTIQVDVPGSWKSARHTPLWPRCKRGLKGTQD